MTRGEIMARRAALLGACALALVACTPSAADQPEQWRAVEIEATPVELGAATVGRLRFRGGLELSSANPAFGGVSDIEVLEDGRLVAISDNGDWFEAQLTLDESGALIGVTGMRTAFMRDEDGEVFPNKRAGDSEDFTQLPDGRFAVAFEQTQSIRIYDFNRDGPFGAAEAGPALAGAQDLPGNVGLEALASTADGALLVGAEGGSGERTPLWLVALDASEPAAERIGYPLHGGFSLTSLDRLPDGGFVAVERFYAPVIGARARITRFPSASLNARGEGLPQVEELATLLPPMPVDNFEAVAAIRMPDGATRVYIASDNNFSPRQRTLLLAFDVIEDAP
ncbi:MAG: esterase-like activity of phytase family protein [Vitreimonas sp.]